MTSLIKGFLLFCLLTCLSGCGAKKDPAEQTIKISINLGDTTADNWYLLTYGKERIKEDTLQFIGGQLKWQDRFHRDTLDLFLLIDNERHLVAPLFPDSLPLQLSLDKEALSVKGSQWSSEIEEWARLRSASAGEVTEALLHLLQEHTDTPFAIVTALDAWLHAPNSYSCTTELTDILFESLDKSSQWATVLGLWHIEKSQIADNYTNFKTHIITEKGQTEHPETQKLMGKKPLMIVAFISTKQANDEEWAFIKQLDSLGYPTYYALPMSDTIPQTWNTTPKKWSTPTWHYFLTDTSGIATEWAKELDVRQLPSYMLVDSNLLILRRWQEREELLRFLDRYKDAKKK